MIKNMTQEEKARAYDEAMNKIKPLYEQAKKDGNPIWSTYEYLIPQLAESEDERMLREIKRYIKEQGDKPNGLPNGTVAISDMIAWLEKQKEYKPSGETNVESDSKIPREEYLYHLLANDIITFTDYTYLMAKKPFDYECANIPQKDYTPVEQKPWKVGANAYFTPERKPADLSEMIVHKEPYIAPVPTPMVADEQKPAEWSNEEYGRLFDIEHYLDGTLQLSPDRRIACIDFLKSLRSQSHWKPSEKQMKYLLMLADYFESEGGTSNAKTLREFHEQLKKLM